MKERTGGRTKKLGQNLTPFLASSDMEESLPMNLESTGRDHLKFFIGVDYIIYHPNGNIIRELLMFKLGSRLNSGCLTGMYGHFNNDFNYFRMYLVGVK